MTADRRRASGIAIAAMLAVALALPGGVLAKRGAGKLSPRLQKLAKPSLRSAPQRVQAKRLSLARHGPGSLLRRGNRIVVDVRLGENVAAIGRRLRSAGAKVLHIDRRYRTASVAVLPSQLTRLAAVEGLASAAPTFRPITRAAGGPIAAVTPYEPCFGADTSEGDVQLEADAVRARFEVAGAETTVGVLSDSFDKDPLTPTGQAEDIVSGDLPGAANPCDLASPVEVLDDSAANGADEGRAMAQIVHDLAPAAKIAFATAFISEASFAANIRALVEDGADVIVDDVTWLTEPFFQEGPIGVAISEATDAGVAYFSAAGNDNLLHEGKEIGSWEAEAFRDAESCPSALAALPPELNADHCMDFDPGAVDPPATTFGIEVEAQKSLIIDLQWAEPRNGVETDLDAYLLDGDGDVIAKSNEKNSGAGGTQMPVEVIGWKNSSSLPETVDLVVNRRAGTGARLKFVLVQSGVSAIEYDDPPEGSGDLVGPTIFGHNGAADANSVGAIRYSTTSAPETFSSRGPVTHYFGPVVGSEPASQLSSPEVLAKPDFVATDGGANTFFGRCSLGAWRFFGTSAAAPHAAALAALGYEAEAAAGPLALSQALREGAQEVIGAPATAVGAGLLNGPAFLEQLGVSPLSPESEPATAPPSGPCAPPREPSTPSDDAGAAVPPIPDPPVVTAAPRSKAPRTFFRRKPRKVVRTRHRRARVVFRFGSNVIGVSYACRVDGGLFRPCRKRFVRRYPVGGHIVRVSARDAEGRGDPTPATYRFRVKRRR